MTPADRPGPDPSAAPRHGWPGRWVVGGLVAVVLGGWWGLDRAFRSWTARYQARAAFGRDRVAPTVDPLARLAPPGVAAAEWREAVAATHALLDAFAGAGLLDEGQMEALRRTLAGEVAQATAHPDRARAILARIWDDLERDAGPVVAPDLVPPPPGSRQARRRPRPARPTLLGPPSRPPRRSVGGQER